jgi:hypothetical protein
MNATILRALLASTMITALIACAEMDGSEDTDSKRPPRENNPAPDHDRDTDSAEEVFMLQEGSWVILENEMTYDECGLSGFLDRGDPGSIMQLASINQMRFEMVYGQGDTYDTGGEVVKCILDENQNFTCDPSKSTSDLPQDYGAKATIHIRILAEGGFFSEQELEVINDVTLSCQGQDCGLVSFFLGTSFPCRMTTWSSAGAE